MLSAARLQVRQNFEANRTLSPESEEYSKQVTQAEEVAKFLRENVVQGQAVDNDTGRYSEQLVPLRSGRGHLLIYRQSSGYTSIPSGETMRISRKQGKGIH